MGHYSPEENVAWLDEMIHRLETAQTDEEARAGMEELISHWTHAFESVSLVGHVLSHLMPELPLGRAWTREQVQSEILPQVRQWRASLASTLPGAPPENRPTRPGCFGGTAAVVIVLALALAALVR